jgi:hypothetical protein
VFVSCFVRGGGIEVSQKLDFGRLLGFDTLRSKSGNVDFQDETVSAKLGAKRGAEPGLSDGSETEAGRGTISAR